MTTPTHGYPDWQRSQDTADVLVQQSNVMLLPGASLTVNALDVRAHHSVAILGSATPAGAPTAFNPARLLMRWTTDDTGTIDVWRDSCTHLARNQTASPFDVPIGPLFVQDNCRGPYLWLDYLNAGPDTLSATLVVQGNSRTVNGPSFRESAVAAAIAASPESGFLLGEAFAVGVGATAIRHMPISQSPVWMRLQTTTQPATWTFRVADGTTLEAVPLPMATVLRQVMHFPAQSVRVEVANTGVAVAIYDTRIVGWRRQW